MVESRLDGGNSITVPASPSLTWQAGSSITWSAWVKAAAPAPNAIIISRNEGSNSFLIGLNNGVSFRQVLMAIPAAAVRRFRRTSGITSRSSPPAPLSSYLSMAKCMEA